MPAHYRPGVGDDPGRYIRHDAGFIEYRYAPAEMVEIVNIEVRPKDRRRGFGRELVNLFIHRVKANARRVFLYTRHTNRPAMEFYDAVGFRRAALIEDFYPDGQGDAVLYVMDLPKPLKKERLEPDPDEAPPEMYTDTPYARHLRERGR